MRSLRARFTFLTTLAVIISILATIVIVSLTVTKYISDRSDDLLALACAEKQESLNYSFNSIEQSVDIVASFATKDYTGADNIEEHVSRVESLFSMTAENTDGILTYYYRIAPEIAGDGVGFWYQKPSPVSTGFVSSPLTEILSYGPDDISHVGWYHIPKQAGEAVWLEPYTNDNMGVDMISYVVPIYHGGTFIGVAGIDFSYDALVADLEDVKEFSTGYAFLISKEGSIIYHNKLERGTRVWEPDSEELAAASVLKESQNGVVKYTFYGEEKRAASTELENDMRLYVTVSESEIDADWERLISTIYVSAAALLAVFFLITLFVVQRVTRPLTKLTRAAEAFESGDYEEELHYTADNEIGRLTRTFIEMRESLKSQIGDLNTMAYIDSLTSVRNKASFDAFLKELDDRIADPDAQTPQFAVCVFDCNGLKEINDAYGHDKGDLYIKSACKLICDNYRHSAVFRMGGDEFIAVLQNEDYAMRDEVGREFDRKAEATFAEAAEPWKRVSVARGISVFDPSADRKTADVVRRADEQMYEMKKRMKEDA